MATANSPPPRLVAHSDTQIKTREENLFNAQHERDGVGSSLYNHPEGEQSFPGGLCMKDRPSPLKRLTSSFSGSVEIYQNRLNNTGGKYLPTKDVLPSGPLSKNSPSASNANNLRTEISRLREEMLLKINALESEMAGHVTTPDTSRDLRGVQSTEKSTQTERSEKAWEENSLLQKIDYKLDNMKKEIFDKLSSLFAAGNDEKQLGYPPPEPPKSIATSSYSQRNENVYVSSSPSSVWSVSPKIKMSSAPPVYHSAATTEHGFTRTTTESNDTNRSYDPSLRANLDYNRIYEPYNRKSPIPHHYAMASTRVSNDNVAAVTTHSGIPSSSNVSYNYEPYQAYSNFDQYSQSNREEMARHMVDQMFQYDDLADANVRGVKGKRLLNPTKIQKIRETVFRTYPVRNSENQEYLWKFICDKINAKCRGVTRTLKRKSNTSEYGHHGPHDVPVRSSMALDYETSKYVRNESYEYERCSFITSSQNNNEHHRQSRSHSASDSDASSIDMASAVASNKTSDPLDRIKAPAPRVSSVSCFSNMVKLENSESFSSITNFDEENIDVKITDDDDDALSEGESAGKDSEFERNNSPPQIFQETSSSSLDICDKLAEKYTDHFPQTLPHDVNSDKKRVQSNREEFTRTLIEAMFTRSTLAHSNVTGARGKFMLDPVKIAKVRETIFRKFPALNEDEEEVLWKILTTKINTKCRGVKRLMKRKGIPAECITKRFQTCLEVETSNKHKVLVVKDQNSFPQSSGYENDTHSKYKINNPNDQ